MDGPNRGENHGGTYGSTGQSRQAPGGLSGLTMPRQGEARAGASWLNILLTLAVAGLSVAFIVGFGGRPAALLSGAGLDDALYVRLGRSLAAGQWLGPYDHYTLVKGVGFPAFLAINNLLGVPYVLGITLVFLAAAGYAAWVLGRVLESRTAGLALFALMLLLPTIYFGDLLRVIREVFYTSTVIALMASAIALATGRALPRTAAVVLTGLFFAWAWLTREEGVWLLPPLAVLAVIPMFLRPDPPRRGVVASIRRLGPFAAAGLTAAILVGLVGAMNQAVYGRFVINEIKDPVFQDALDALQEASSPLAREMQPVPRAARARLYAVSPAFASVRDPILDGPLSAAYAAAGCGADSRLCGDIGGGWFMWVFREAAAGAGHHRSLGQSRTFYRQVSAEVRAACDARRIACRSWDVPLVPPMRASQADDVAASAAKAFRAMTFSEPVGAAVPPSDMSAPQATAMYEFLNRPAHGETAVSRTLLGWFRHQGPRWFEITPGPGVKVVRLDRRDSADLAVWFKDPGVTRHRYELTVDCPAAENCPVTITLEDGQGFPLDLARLPKAGPVPLGPAELYVDSNVASVPDTFLKAGLSRKWVAFASGLNPFYRILLAVGAVAFLILLVRAVVVRRLSLGLVVCTALAAAVATRVVILALIDALSFPAANFSYGLPAVPLLVLFAVVAIHEALTLAAARMRRRAA